MSVVRLLGAATAILMGLVLAFSWDIGLNFAEALGVMGIGLAVEVFPADLP